MNLLDRIRHALNDSEHAVDPKVFEECATDLLSELHPNLVPIRGGSDSGRDADLVGLERDPPVRVAITSSRSYEGARRNLRGAIDSLKRHEMPGTAVVSASLAVLNQDKRKKLELLAENQGFKLINIVDRAFFADRLRVAGDWRSRLLRLPGGPFSLSETSGYSSADPHIAELVGRDELIKQLSEMTSDALVWGHPGVGKSSVLERVPGLYFVDGAPLAERLQDDVLATNPKILVVDDASRRLPVLETLLQIRKHEAIPYVVVAVCWPHERESVGAYFSPALEVEVELLTRSEVAEIVRGRGIGVTP